MKQVAVITTIMILVGFVVLVSYLRFTGSVA